jgi:hypothetical protein
MSLLWKSLIRSVLLAGCLSVGGCVVGEEEEPIDEAIDPETSSPEEDEPYSDCHDCDQAYEFCWLTCSTAFGGSASDETACRIGCTNDWGRCSASCEPLLEE